MRRNPAILTALICAAVGLLTALPAAADRIYKYVDKEGVVTYSSTPPRAADLAREVTQLDTPAAPRPEDVEAARKRAEEQAKLSRELLRERRQVEAEYERIRVASAEQSLRDELAAAQYPSDGVYYPASGYLPYYSMWGVPGMKNRPPFRDNPPFFRSHFHKSPASFTLEPRRVHFRRR